MNFRVSHGGFSIPMTKNIAYSVKVEVGICFTATEAVYDAAHLEELPALL